MSHVLPVLGTYRGADDPFVFWPTLYQSICHGSAVAGSLADMCPSWTRRIPSLPSRGSDCMPSCVRLNLPKWYTSASGLPWQWHPCRAFPGASWRRHDTWMSLVWKIRYFGFSGLPYVLTSWRARPICDGQLLLAATCSTLVPFQRGSQYKAAGHLPHPVQDRGAI